MSLLWKIEWRFRIWFSERLATKSGRVGPGHGAENLRVRSQIQSLDQVSSTPYSLQRTLNDSFSPPLSAMFSPCVFFPLICSVKYKSLFSLASRLSTRHCPHLLLRAVAVLRRRCCWAPAPAISPTRRMLLLLSIDGWWDRQTDGRTLDRFIDPAPHILCGQGQLVANKTFLLWQWQINKLVRKDRERRKISGFQW